VPSSLNTAAWQWKTSWIAASYKSGNPGNLWPRTRMLFSPAGLRNPWKSLTASGWSFSSSHSEPRIQFIHGLLYTVFSMQSGMLYDFKHSLTLTKSSFPPASKILQKVWWV
jgi:hypothetical protein